MKKEKTLQHILIWVIAGFISLVNYSCSKDDMDVRQPNDILGVWSPSNDTYLEFCEENIVHRLQIENQDNETIGLWTKDVYYYEPGYNLVIYLRGETTANVYEIVSMNENSLTWCWVDEVEPEDTESIGRIIGDIIKKAQAGYHLNPSLYQTFRKIPENEFFNILDSLDINYPF